MFQLFIPTSVGGNADSPVIELAWTATIDSVSDPNWTGTINDLTTQIIDRPDTDGIYTSQSLTINASTLDKLYWKETFPSGGGDVTFDIRMGATESDLAVAIWNTGYTDSTGSDISGATSSTDTVLMQYRVNMNTNTITETPTLFRESNYVVRITFDIAGSTEEAAITLKHRNGWDDYGAPGIVKTLTKLYVYYDWPEDTAGTLNLTFEGIGTGVYSAINPTQEETDTFAIDLLANPNFYVERFQGGSLIGELIRLSIEESSTQPIRINKIIVIYTIQKDLT